MRLGNMTATQKKTLTAYRKRQKAKILSQPEDGSAKPGEEDKGHQTRDLMENQRIGVREAQQHRGKLPRNKPLGD